MVNLPHVMRALDLHEWFFNKMRNGKHFLLGTYIIGNEEDLDKDYQCCLDMIHQTRTAVHTLNKLNFLHGIGFGENSLTIKLFANLHGTSAELQERFDCLLRTGIKYSSLCRMVTVSPKFLNQDVEILEQKVKFLVRR
ncbi:unnamed protein product [Thlaspi arvense]|uniref:Uncharacterized protein n=1 Tax=Thlaspi arvense TaxID=13288 RepID=A0AAU9RFT3_THLAR|nr:unnamed protein product [Thlaspi arvense]